METLLYVTVVQRERGGTWHDGTAFAGALQGRRGDAVKEVGGLLRPQKTLGGISSGLKAGYSYRWRRSFCSSCLQLCTGQRAQNCWFGLCLNPFGSVPGSSQVLLLG